MISGYYGSSATWPAETVETISLGLSYTIVFSLLIKQEDMKVVNDATRNPGLLHSEKILLCDYSIILSQVNLSLLQLYTQVCHIVKYVLASSGDAP